MAGGSFDENRGGGIISGINVTPLVDITLVLLIIFIVTARMVVSPSVPLDLPQATTGEDTQVVFSVFVLPSGALELDGQPLHDDATLTARAREARATTPDLRAVIQADGSVPHRRVLQVLDLLRASGLSKVAFATAAEGKE